MKVVVTGGAGYIGSMATSHLLACGMDVTVYDRLVYGGESLLAHMCHPRFVLVSGDVRDPERLDQALNGADAVVHLAAIVGDPACAIDPDDSWTVNLGGTEAVLQSARRTGVK